jgi:hypothetical protein
MHTAKRASAVFDFSYLCLWPRDALEYLGLCSHSASEEPPVASSKEEFTQEEIEAQELGMAALKASRADERKKCQDARKARNPAKYASARMLLGPMPRP